jgi:hypothetical protein
MAGSPDGDDRSVLPPTASREEGGGGASGATAGEEPHMERQVSEFQSLASGEPATPSFFTIAWYSACQAVTIRLPRPHNCPAPRPLALRAAAGVTHRDGSNGGLDTAPSKGLSLQSLDLEKLGPELRALSMRHSTEELQVVARLTSGAHLTAARAGGLPAAAGQFGSVLGAADAVQTGPI